MHAEPIDPRSETRLPSCWSIPTASSSTRTAGDFSTKAAALSTKPGRGSREQIHFETPGRTAYAILDSRLFDIAGFERAIRSEVAPHRGRYSGELAGLIGIDPPALTETVTAYQSAATGDPALFDAARRDGLAASAWLDPPKSNWARAIEKPPFLAYPLVGASPTPSAVLPPTRRRGARHAMVRFPASLPPAKSPGISGEPRPMRFRSCGRWCSGASRGARRFRFSEGKSRALTAFAGRGRGRNATSARNIASRHPIQEANSGVDCGRPWGRAVLARVDATGGFCAVTKPILIRMLVAAAVCGATYDAHAQRWGCGEESPSVPVGAGLFLRRPDTPTTTGPIYGHHQRDRGHRYREHRGLAAAAPAAAGPRLRRSPIRRTGCSDASSARTWRQVAVAVAAVAVPAGRSRRWRRWWWRRDRARGRRRCAPAATWPPAGETSFVSNDRLRHSRQRAGADARAIAARHGMTRLETTTIRLTGRTLHVWRIDNGAPVDEVIRNVCTNPADRLVAGAQPNYLYGSRSRRSTGPAGARQQRSICAARSSSCSMRIASRAATRFSSR